LAKKGTQRPDPAAGIGEARLTLLLLTRNQKDTKSTERTRERPGAHYKQST